MKLYKKIAVSLITSLTTVIIVFGGYTIYAADPSDFKSNAAADAFSNYHGEMNAYFNEKMLKLNELMEDENFYKDPKKKELLLPPASIDTVNDSLETIVEKCGKDNVSTYCVSIGALRKYTTYVEFLNNLKGTLDLENLAYVPILNALSNMTGRNLKIDEEIDQAQATMKATIAAYNEFRLAYPMHQKYEEIIEDLVKYKLALKDIRKRVAQFPGKFIDATSSQCK